jgi:alpha-L-arabinofuranosidase
LLVSEDTIVIYRNTRFARLAVSILVAAATPLLAQTEAASPAAIGSLVVQADQPGVKISPALYGLFFEEINFAGDGGLYGELLRNRNFEESASEPTFWSLVLQDGAAGRTTVEDRGASESFNRHHLKLAADPNSKGRVGVANDGYWGVPVKKDAHYKFTIIASSADVPALRASLENRAGAVYAEQSIALAKSGIADASSQEVELVSSGTDPNARLVLSFEGAGSVTIDYASLFPLDTFKKRINGLRPELAERLAALKPSFVRFPGGCWVEGDTMATASRWKRTIGPLPARWTQANLWGYKSPNGLGYHEYLQMCEDLGADALFVVNCGMSHHDVVPMDQMGEYVQDALDAIEYAVGAADSTWGKRRAEAGHPAPFNLRYVEIGNENGGPAYNERYALIYDAIKAKYPQIQTVACLWNGRPNSRPIDILDEHYYDTPQFFFRNANRYDTYDRKGPKIYVGEYAVTRGSGAGNLISAVGEAAFMTGMERNSDVVTMSSYAPLFTHVEGKRWNPDLINFDNVRSYGTPSYHVQQMFASNKGDIVLPVEMALPTSAMAKKVELKGSAGVGTWSTRAEFKDFKVLAPDGNVLYETTFKNADDWRGISRESGAGAALPAAAVAQGQTGAGGARRWEVRDGVLASVTGQEGVTATVGDRNWTDYSVNVKARKLSGDEGFLVLVRHENADNYVWANIGGWRNNRTAIERSHDGDKQEIGTGSDFKVEANRWYDIRVEVKGEQIAVFVDDKQVASARDQAAPQTRVFTTASLEESTGDVIVKVVNALPQSQEFKLSVRGTKTLATRATATVLSGSPEDENTLDAPAKVSPQTARIIDVREGTFRHVFPACSVTVIRVPSDR